MFALGLCSLSIQAQKTEQGPCDSIKYMYDQALYFLDSSIGNQNELHKQLEGTKLEISKLKTEVSRLGKSKNDVTADLEKARKLITEQMQKIERLEAEVKQLSPPAKSSKQKGT